MDTSVFGFIESSPGGCHDIARTSLPVTVLDFLFASANSVGLRRTSSFLLLHHRRPSCFFGFYKISQAAKRKESTPEECLLHPLVIGCGGCGISSHYNTGSQDLGWPVWPLPFPKNTVAFGHLLKTCSIGSSNPRRTSTLPMQVNALSHDGDWTRQIIAVKCFFNFVEKSTKPILFLFP